MVVIYDLNTKEIIRVEDNTNAPILPFNMTLEEKKKHFKNNNQNYIVLNEEMGANIYNYNLIFDDKGEFKNIQIKEGLNG